MSLRWLHIALLCAASDAAAGCSARDEALAESITAGNAARGRQAFHRLGCGSCHEIDGDRTTQGHAGPRLEEFALQSYLPGGLANEPAALVRWIRDPRDVAPGTAMPDLGVAEQDARDLAAYLYTLR
jgi:cytochrome c